MKKIAIIATLAFAALGMVNTADAATFVYGGGLLKMSSSYSQQAYDLQSCLVDLGVNSASNVDGYFGPMTKAAVMAFQANAGVSVDGIIGPITGPLYTAACAGNTSSVDTTNLPAGCTSTAGYSVTTGNKCDAVEVIIDDTPTLIGNNGEEVNFTGFDVDDAADTTIDENANKAELGSIQFKNEDSDVLLERFDVVLDADTSASATDENDAWKAFDKLYIYVDGDMVASMDSDTKADWKDRTIAGAYNDNDNRFRFSGLNTVLSKDQDHEIVVKADINSSVDMDANGAQWVMVVDPTTMRFVDEAGITSYLNEEDGNALDFTAAFSIVAAGNQDELQVKSNSNNPDSTTFEVKSGQESDEYTTFIFDVEADKDGGDLEISDFTLTADTGIKNFDAVVKDVTLKIGGEEETYDVAKSTALNALNTNAPVKLFFDFDGKEITVNSGDTEKAEVLVRFKSTNTQTAYTNGETIKFSATAADVDAWTVDGADTLTTTQLTGSAVGDTHQLSEEGVIATLKNSSVSTTVDNNGKIKTATYTMDVELEAFGNTFYTSKAGINGATVGMCTGADTTSTNQADCLNPLANGGAGVWSTNALSFSVEDSADATVGGATTAFALESSASTDAGAWRIDEGQKETITLVATVSGPTVDTYTRVQLNDVQVFTDNALTAGAQTTSLLPVEDYESALQLIQA